jgi:arginase family enzyme
MKQKDKSHRITYLNFDNSLKEQTFLQYYPHHWICCSNIPHTNGFCETESLNEIRKRLQVKQVSPLVLIGNGNFHYVTYLLLERVKGPFSLILFDHHDDMKKDDFSLISCGSWVRYALERNANLNKVVIIGVNEENQTCDLPNELNKRVLTITEQKIKDIHLQDIVHELRQFLPEEKNIYISIDKDVLYKREAYTNWDQGSMTLVQLLFLLENIVRHFQVVGMDICGEYVVNHQNEFERATWEYVKMNEIVNRALLKFVEEYISPPEESLLF